MKNLRFVLIAAFSLLLTATSCQKEKTPEPTPTAVTTAPVVTYGTFSADIALVDMTSTAFGCPNSWGSVRTAYVVCNGVKIDSLTGLNVHVDSGASSPSLSTLISVANSKSFKVQDGSDNYLEIYSDGVKVASCTIDRTNNKLNGINLGGCPNYPGNYGNTPGGYPTLCNPTW
jgi:hypothetical protein